MEARCHCDFAAKGPARHVIRLLEGHRCHVDEESEQESGVTVGFRPNPVD